MASRFNGRRQRDGGNRPVDLETRLSKLLSWILRHNAANLGLRMREDGYVSLDAVLALDRMKAIGADEGQVRRVVASNDKQRFSLTQSSDGRWLIRANQGHSGAQGSLIDDGKMMTPLVDANKYPSCFHGTYMQYWPAIKSSGLRVMGRKHIHIAAVPGRGVISGMRSTCDVMIFIDLNAALKDGIKFWISDNGVILTEGVNGCLPPRYFKRVDHIQPDGSVQQLSVDAAFDYLLVLDFEATCEERKDGAKRFHPQEVIEFPCIAVNTRTGKQDFQFHRYIRPVVHPQLTDFCTDLTGITQAMVQDQADFTTVFQQFQEWMRECHLSNDGVAGSKTFAFVTCGDWDLKTMLPMQCSVSKIARPAAFQQWINIKHLYGTVFHTKAKGMMDMLQSLGIKHEGRHHSGIDDVKNICNICTHMLQRGVLFTITSAGDQAKKRRPAAAASEHKQQRSSHAPQQQATAAAASSSAASASAQHDMPARPGNSAWGGFRGGRGRGRGRGRGGH